MTNIEAHRRRIWRVLRHIHQHLDTDLSLEILSGIAAFSPFHFHRLFRATLGVGLHRYVLLARMRRASFRLAFRPMQDITTIALDSGYDSTEGFARAFRRIMGQSPQEFRLCPDWTRWRQIQQQLNEARNRIMQNAYSADLVRIVDFPATKVAILSHQGDPAQLGLSIRRLIGWRRSVRLSPAISATFNILHNDPDLVAAEDFRLDLCVATDMALLPNDHGIVPGVIPSGPCAVLRLTGADPDMRGAFDYLYASWLPDSGRRLRDAPAFVQRVSFFPDVADEDAVTDLFLPLQ